MWAACIAAWGVVQFSEAHAAAFALQENSASGMGNAFAGGAASVQDASILWQNAAGIAYLERPEVTALVNVITPSARFNDRGSTTAFGQARGGGGGDVAKTTAIPNLYASWPIDRQWTVGIGINAPFGLSTEYGFGWQGRYHALDSEIAGIGINPTLAWRPVPELAVGVGVNYLMLDAKFSNAVNYSAALASAAQRAATAGQLPAALVPAVIAATGGMDATARIDGKDNAWGWNVGLLWRVNDASQVGLSYRSDTRYDARGTARFDRPALPAAVPATLAPAVNALMTGVNAVLADGDVNAKIKLPGIANLSWFGRFDDRWDLMADVQFTHWSVVKDLTFVRSDTGAVLQSTPHNLRDAWRFAIGANYRIDDRWLLRGGIAYDQTPTTDTFRTPRLPDPDRQWVSLGVRYAPDPNWAFELAGTYMFHDDVTIRQGTDTAAATGILAGTYESHVFMMAGSVRYRF